jgi:hypothetical protein
MISLAELAGQPAPAGAPCPTCADWGPTYPEVITGVYVPCPDCGRPTYRNEGVNFPAGSGVYLSSNRGRQEYLRVERAEAAKISRERHGTRGEGEGRGGSPVRRNDPCPCGSYQKFKRCCGRPR